MDDEQGLLFVESITNLNKKQTAYNFTVADFHTYYVTEHNVLVHNCDGKAGDSNALVPKSTGKKSRNKPPEPLAEAEGRPHSIIEKPGADGQYTTHNGDGTFKQFRGSGKPHGNIPRPNVKENSINRTPDGREFINKPTVRPPKPNEIPGA